MDDQVRTDNFLHKFIATFNTYFLLQNRWITLNRDRVPLFFFTAGSVGLLVIQVMNAALFQKVLTSDFFQVKNKKQRRFFQISKNNYFFSAFAVRLAQGQVREQHPQRARFPPGLQRRQPDHEELLRRGRGRRSVRGRGIEFEKRRLKDSPITEKNFFGNCVNPKWCDS